MNNLEECFAELSKILESEIIEDIKNTPEENLYIYHHCLSKFLINKCNLWTFTGLRVFHPDDLSGIIITSFHRYLCKEPINLESLINYYEEYWKSKK
ncbi:MAG: DUF6794 domain-containing protein [Patescibacteria group bacterium]|jgi:hypothetical protein